MERLYQICIERMASLAHVNISTVLAIEGYVNLCRNLSINLHSKRHSKSVMDFAEIFPLDIAIPVLGIASPLVIILTLVLNICVVKVLTNKKLKSPTNVILVTIAILDMATGCLRLPWYMYTYSLGGYKTLPDVIWCNCYYYLFRVTPVLIHTASLWSTVLLAFQRYVGISQLRKISCVCQYKGLIGCFVGIGVFSFIVHSFQLSLVKLEPIQVVSNELFTDEGMLSYTNTCSLTYRDEDFRLYFSQYYGWIRLILAQILPCVLLGIFNILLLRITIKGYRYRRRLVRGNKVVANRELRTTLRMSIMLILITGSTLLAEAFVAILLVVQTTQTHIKSLLMEPTTISKSIVVSNFMILFTFPLNFLFYFSMSSRFRRHFVFCFVQRKHRRIIPLLIPSIYRGDDEDDEDDDEEPGPISSVPMNNLQARNSTVSRSN